MPLEVDIKPFDMCSPLEIKLVEEYAALTIRGGKNPSSRVKVEEIPTPFDLKIL